MARLCILSGLIIGVVLIVACVPVAAQPTPLNPAGSATATLQPTAVPVPPTPLNPTASATATLQPTAVPVPPTPLNPTASATATALPTKASATSTPQASAGGPPKLNLDDYFPKGPGRDLVLRDCTTCHSFAPVIMGQRPNARWLSLKEDHRDKTAGASPADYDAEFAYLMENFNNNKPEPKLPDWFLQQQPGIGE